MYPLQEAALCDALFEGAPGREMIVASVYFARSRRPSGGRDRDRNVGKQSEDLSDDGAFPGAGRPRDDEDRRDAYSSRAEMSSRRCRSESPPTVLLGLTRQRSMMRAALTRPYLGAAMRTSRILAV